MFTIDNTEWTYPCDITREAEIRSTDVSGEMLDGSYYNDVQGTYMSYTVKVVGPLNQRDALASLYNQLVAPVEGHRFVLPYNGSTVILNTGRIESVSDVFVRLPGGGQYWRGLQFTVIANHPTYAATASGVVARGRPVMPEEVDASEGDTWIWHNGAWVRSVEYIDADVKRY